ncbi:MAG: DUF1992 domain-containing protein [Pseudomonadota bacterium]
MSRKFRERTEAQIRKASAEGQFDNLPGAGKPLPAHPEEAMIDPMDAVGNRIMAEAGALPAEITLKKQMDAARAAWQSATDPDEKARLMAEIARLNTRYEIAREARKTFQGP